MSILSEVDRCSTEKFGVVPEGSESSVAVHTEQTTDALAARATGRAAEVIVVDVWHELRERARTDEALVPLSLHHLLQLLGSDAIPLDVLESTVGPHARAAPTTALLVAIGVLIGVLMVLGAVRLLCVFPTSARSSGPPCLHTITTAGLAVPCSRSGNDVRVLGCVLMVLRAVCLHAKDPF